MLSASLLDSKSKFEGFSCTLVRGEENLVVDFKTAQLTHHDMLLTDLRKYFKNYRLKVKGSMFLESFELLHLKSLKVLRTVYRNSTSFHSKINKCN